MAADGHFASASLGAARNAKSEGRKWRFFLLRGDGDVHAAIEWLAEAYQMARRRR
jgi:transketolase N-terminal domain/subunit